MTWSALTALPSAWVHGGPITTTPILTRRASVTPACPLVQAASTKGLNLHRRYIMQGPLILILRQSMILMMIQDLPLCVITCGLNLEWPQHFKPYQWPVMGA